MADDINALDASGATVVVAAKDIGAGKKAQRMMIEMGTTDVADGNPFPTYVKTSPELEPVADGVGILRWSRRILLPAPDAVTLHTVATVINDSKRIAANTTDQVIVAAVAAKVVRIIRMAIIIGPNATSVTFKSKPAGAATALEDVMDFGPYGGIETGVNEHGIFKDNTAGDALTVDVAAGGSPVTFHFSYIQF